MKPGYFAISCLLLAFLTRWTHADEPLRYLRFQKGEMVAYGILEGDQVRQLAGDLFGNYSKTEVTHHLADVKLLPPTVPSQVLAMAGNYRSHIAGTATPAKFQFPQPFLKSPSCLIGHDDAIVIPKDARDVHFEAELVIVIGKECRKVSRDHGLLLKT